MLRRGTWTGRRNGLEGAHEIQQREIQIPVPEEEQPRAPVLTGDPGALQKCSWAQSDVQEILLQHVLLFKLSH